MNKKLNRSLPAFVLLALMSGEAAAQVDSVLWQNKNDFVRLERADGPAPAAAGVSPLYIGSDAVKAILGAVKVSDGSGESRLLSEEQVDLIAEPVARGLRTARPGQDVAFAVHTSSIMSYLGPPHTTAGRIFVDGDGFGVIIGMVNESFTTGFVKIDATSIRTGSRLASQESTFRVVPGGAVALGTSGRGDWARVSPMTLAGSFGLPVMPPAAMAAPAAPPQVVAPMGSTAPVASAISGPVPHDPQQIEQRFAALKRLLDQKMITQEDYDRSKAELLKAMAQPQ